jgi:hypothetical protein
MAHVRLLYQKPIECPPVVTSSSFRRRRSSASFRRIHHGPSSDSYRPADYDIPRERILQSAQAMLISTPPDLQIESMSNFLTHIETALHQVMLQGVKPNHRETDPERDNRVHFASLAIYEPSIYLLNMVKNVIKQIETWTYRTKRMQDANEWISMSFFAVPPHYKNYMSPLADTSL